MPTRFILLHIATESVNLGIYSHPDTSSQHPSSTRLFHGNISVDEKTAVAEEIKFAFDYDRTDLPEPADQSNNGSAQERIQSARKPSKSNRLGKSKTV